MQLILPASTFLALVASSHALEVTAPQKGAEVDLSQDTTVEWTSVDTDPEQFDIVLTNNKVNPSVSIPIATDVDVSDGSFVIPGSEDFTPGSDYRVNLESSTSRNDGILAQSQQFDVSAPGAAPASGSSDSNDSEDKSSDGSDPNSDEAEAKDPSTDNPDTGEDTSATAGATASATGGDAAATGSPSMTATSSGDGSETTADAQQTDSESDSASETASGTESGSGSASGSRSASGSDSGSASATDSPNSGASSLKIFTGAGLLAMVVAFFA